MSGAVLAGALGIAAGVVSAAVVIAELRNAEEVVEVGEAATRSLYYYCMSYTGTYLGAGRYGGSDGAAGARAARTDMERIAAEHHTTVDEVRRAARSLGARGVYRSVFDGAMPRYRDDAARRVGSVVRFADDIEGQLMRARWGGSVFNRLGGSQGL